MIDVFYAVNAESFSSLDLKNGEILNHETPTFYDFWTARISFKIHISSYYRRLEVPLI